MKKFRFPLRTVATLRGLQELRARETFAAAVRTYVQAEKVLAEIRQRLAELREILLNERRATFRARDQASFLEAFHNETVRETEGKCEVVSAKNAMELRRQEWLETRRGVKLIANLEHKARETHRHTGDREMQGELDEIAGNRRPLVAI
jgi:flagellar FliJ protein